MPFLLFSLLFLSFPFLFFLSFFLISLFSIIFISSFPLFYFIYLFLFFSSPILSLFLYSSLGLLLLSLSVIFLLFHNFFPSRPLLFSICLFFPSLQLPFQLFSPSYSLINWPPFPLLSASSQFLLSSSSFHSSSSLLTPLFISFLPWIVLSLYSSSYVPPSTLYHSFLVFSVTLSSS